MAAMHETREFEEICHQLASRDLYPTWFPNLIRVRNMAGTFWDHEHGIDSFVCQTVLLHNQWQGPRSTWTSIQERWRRPNGYALKDITISDTEIPKIKAEFFAYGFADKQVDPTRITRAVLVNMATLKQALANNRLIYGIETHGRGDQQFLTIGLVDLEKIGAITAWHGLRSIAQKKEIELQEMQETWDAIAAAGLDPRATA